MTSAEPITVLMEVMLDAVILAGVPLAVATLLGLIISFFQAITQIQDQSLSQTAKIAAIAVILFAAGGTLATPLFLTTRTIFDTFPNLVP